MSPRSGDRNQNLSLFELYGGCERSTWSDTQLVIADPASVLSFRADSRAGHVKTRSDHACVAPALLPVLASSRRTLLHRQECLCHTILATAHLSFRAERGICFFRSPDSSTGSS